jgi:hypothetical protein
MNRKPGFDVKVQELMRLRMKYFDYRQEQRCADNEQPVEESIPCVYTYSPPLGTAADATGHWTALEL